MTDTPHDRDRETTLYRLIVAGRVGTGWLDWFGADRVEPGDDETVVMIRVADQAELFGRLRRVQDLNLRLLHLSLVAPDPGDTPSRGGASPAAPRPHDSTGDLP